MKVYILYAKSESGDNYCCAFRNKPSDDDINRACLGWDVEELTKEAYEDFDDYTASFELDGKYYRSYCLCEVSEVNLIEN